MYKPNELVKINDPRSDYHGQTLRVHTASPLALDEADDDRYYHVDLPDGAGMALFTGHELLPAERPDEETLVDAEQPTPKAYLAGPISNEPNWREYFHAAAEGVEAQGFKVLNPEEIEEDGHTREYYMKLGIERVLEADTVVLLPGWENSRGALVEYQVALESGKDIQYLDGAFRGEPLELTASKLVRNGDRERTYGHPAIDMDRFTIILTGILQGYLKPEVRVPVEFGPLVALGLKLSRAANDPRYIDTRTDLVGWSIVFDRVMQAVGGNHD